MVKKYAKRQINSLTVFFLNNAKTNEILGWIGVTQTSSILLLHNFRHFGGNQTTEDDVIGLFLVVTYGFLDIYGKVSCKKPSKCFSNNLSVA